MIKPSYEAMQTEDPTFTAFNGRAFRYRDKPMKATVGKPQRIYVVAAGPTLGSDFHVVGEIFDTVQPDGNPLNVLDGVSTFGVPAGGGAMFELTFDEAGATRSSPTHSAGPTPVHSGCSRPRRTSSRGPRHERPVRPADLGVDGTRIRDDLGGASLGVDTRNR